MVHSLPLPPPPKFQSAISLAQPMSARATSLVILTSLWYTLMGAAFASMLSFFTRCQGYSAHLAHVSVRRGFDLFFFSAILFVFP
jgi:uncharacterized membrane protein YgcG